MILVFLLFNYTVWIAEFILLLVVVLPVYLLVQIVRAVRWALRWAYGLMAKKWPKKPNLT